MLMLSTYQKRQRESGKSKSLFGHELTMWEATTNNIQGSFPTLLHIFACGDTLYFKQIQNQIGIQKA